MPPLSLDPTSSAPTPSTIQRQRRKGVSAQAVTQERMSNWKPQTFPKTQRDRAQIFEVIDKQRVLFGHLSMIEKQQVVDAMRKAEYSAGSIIIRQGDEGDNFYVLVQGKVSYHVARNGTPSKMVGTAESGSCFGELALLYNAPRAATVKAEEACVLWALDQDTFQMMLTTGENTKKRTYEDFLENIQIFKGLNKYERVQLSDMLTQAAYRPGEKIISQGEQGDRFYIVEDGESTCLVEEDGAELPVCQYSKGGYFGELALMGDGIRRASVFASTRCKVLSIDRPTFDRVLGPIRDIFSNNMEIYRSVLNDKQAAWLEKYAEVKPLESHRDERSRT